MILATSDSCLALGCAAYQQRSRGKPCTLVLAEERKRKRKALLAATEPALARTAGEVGRRTNTPLSAAQIGQKVGRVINRHQVANLLEPHIGDGRFDFSRRQ